MKNNQENKKVSKKEESSNQNLAEAQQLIDSMENNLRNLKELLFSAELKKQADSLLSSERGNLKIIEGVFDGENMIDKDGKKYLVAANYTSKSKLVPGDVLKLSITAEGTFIFKQIGPVPRKKIIGTLIENNGRFIVNAEGNNYHVVTASITYFKAKPGDKLTIIIPRDQPSAWAAVENVVG